MLADGGGYLSGETYHIVGEFTSEAIMPIQVGKLSEIERRLARCAQDVADREKATASGYEVPNRLFGACIDRDGCAV